ncbi:hypothetical protein ACFLU5_01460 [Bacteroidota bacterium]
MHLRNFLIFPIFLFVLNSGLKAQTKEITLLEIIQKAVAASPGEKLYYNNYTINKTKFQYKYLFEYFKRRVNPELRTLEEGRLLIPANISFRNCHFTSLLLDRVKLTGELKFSNCTFEGDIEIINSEINQFQLENSKTKHLIIIDAKFNDYCVLQLNTLQNLNIAKSAFYGVNWFINDIETEISIEKCVFHPVKNECNILSDSIGYGRPINNNLQVAIESMNRSTIPYLNIRNCEFLSNSNINKVNIQADLIELIIEDNLFQSAIDMHGSSIEKRLIFRSNHLGNYIGFNDVIFTEFFNMLEWDQFAGNKICIFEDTPPDLVKDCPNNFGFRGIDDDKAILYLAENYEELENQNAYRLLISIYQRLFNIYKSNGDIKSSNGCYSEMKDVQSRMLKHRFSNSRTFDNFFRLKLAQLLKIYVNYGTDPARAITISVWVVLIFGIFYFFFPSEWDVASKSKLINDFKSFIDRNEKGYYKPFLSMVLGFLISLLNALTLSLNSFVTLGFGNIPTRGLARYICIIQGFIGWFLLSIFTVALINQVLA